YTVDTRGYLCPQPLIMARNAMKEIAEGEELRILSDNETSVHNLIQFLSDLGAAPKAEQQEGGEYYIEAVRPTDSDTNIGSDPKAYCSVPETPSSKPYVVVARSNKMGEGDNDLGDLLIRGYLNALTGIEDLPAHFIMYNSGVKLTLKGTDTAGALGELEDRGVSIIVCGTCTDYYQIKGEVGVGRISNMHHIAGILAGAGHVIYL
ncbi:MAG: sulfurtransferase-like selenium metabolism protein YedF, partial [Marinilabilia sp.]